MKDATLRAFAQEMPHFVLGNGLRLDRLETKDAEQQVGRSAENVDQRLRDAAQAIDGSRETTGDLLRRGEGDAFRREFADDQREKR
ncbi:MAG: hypothetical protein WAM53_18550, partial [Terrimicrobiaceae bacterium]